MKARQWLPILLLVLAPLAARAETPTSDPKAVKIADEVIKTLGGKDKFDKLPGIKWTFEVAVNDTVKGSRTSSWDKMSGWYRVQGKTRTGDSYVLIKKVGADEGKAWMNGNAIEGDSLQKLLKRAQSLWTNDGYWLMMPYKLRDPGVNLMYAGDTTLAGRHYDKLSLTFQNVGETPGDHYWVYVNRDNHMIERWDMVLQSDQPPPKSYTWEGWEKHDGLMFATAHKQGPAVVYTKNVETVSKFPPTEFTTP